VIGLPGNKGFVELLVEPVNPPSGKNKGVVAAYFLSPDGSGPLAPTPTGVTFTPLEGQPLKLEPKGDHLASEPAPFLPGQELGGELSAGVGGETVKVPVRTR
jgi:hypothetical protein